MSEMSEMSDSYGLLFGMEQSDVMTASQVAAAFGVSSITVKRWADDGKLAFFLTPGGHYRFHASDVAALRTEATT